MIRKRQKSGTTTITPTNIRLLSEYDFDEPEVRRVEPRTEASRRARESLRSRINVARALLLARLDRGWTQKELADRVGTRQSRISELESVNGNPRFETLDRSARALGLEVRLVDRVAAGVISGPFESDLSISVSRVVASQRRGSFRPLTPSDFEQMLKGFEPDVLEDDVDEEPRVARSGGGLA